jgi:hypothetical protein
MEMFITEKPVIIPQQIMCVIQATSLMVLTEGHVGMMGHGIPPLLIVNPSTVTSYSIHSMVV